MEKYYVIHDFKKREFELSISNRIINESGIEIIKKLVDEWLPQIGIKGELHLEMNKYKHECYIKNAPCIPGERNWTVVYTQGPSNVKILIWRWEPCYTIKKAE